MPEVSSRVLLSHLEHLDHRNLTSESNLEYLLSDVEILGLTSPDRWREIPLEGSFKWESYSLFINKMKEIFPKDKNWVEDFIDYSFSNIERTPFLYYGLQISKYALSLRHIYRLIEKWGGPNLFPIMQTQWEDHSNGFFSITITIPDGFTVVPEFFELSYLTFKKYPDLIRIPSTEIQYEIMGQSAKYLILDKSSGTFRRFFKNVYGALANSGSFMQFLRDQDELFRHNYYELWRSQTELEKIHMELEERIQERTKALEKANQDLQAQIKKRMGIEESLRASEKRYKYVVENTLSGIWELDEEFKTVFVNPFLCRLLGQPEEKILGKSPLDLTPEDQHPIIEKHWESCKQGIANSLSYSVLNKTGQRVHLQVDYTPVLSGNTFKGAISIVRNVTDEILEREIFIKHEVEKRQTRKLEALGTLAGGVAHDFNNIIQGIYSSLSLALSTIEDDHPAKARIESALSFGDRGRKVVEQILIFSRKEKSDYIVIDLVKVVKDAIPLLKEAVGENFQIQTKFQVESAPLLGNSYELAQTLLNLCVNSSYACSGQGAVLIEVSQESADASRKNKYILTVTDTGPGIEHEIQDRIYEPFFSTKPPGTGTGMGLAITHGIIERHHGRITYDSSYTDGARFIISLPTHAGKPEDSTTTNDDFIVQGEGERILIVEDENLIRELLSKQLEELGYKVTQAQNGIQAALILENSDKGFDLVLTDLTMPEMSGDGLIKWMLDSGFNIPVILFTGFRPPDSITHLKGGILRACLSKPLPLSLLSQKIRSAIGSQKSTK